MSLFQSTTSAFGGGSGGLFGSSGQTTTTTGSHNPMRDVEVTSPPDDSISSLEFSPSNIAATFLIAGSWDNNVSDHIHINTKKHQCCPSNSRSTHCKIHLMKFYKSK